MPGTKSAPPIRQTNESMRTREWLTEAEVGRLRAAAGKLGRYGHRDATMILLAFRHGFRPIELVGLRWEQIDFEQRVLHVRRAKHGSPSTHPLGRTELAELRKLGKDRTGHVFLSQRGRPMTTSAYYKIMARAGKHAGIDLKIHPHMMRHSCGYYLAGQGHDTRAIQAYLGHRNIQHTVIYTELAPDRFKSFWKD